MCICLVLVFHTPLFFLTYKYQNSWQNKRLPPSKCLLSHCNIPWFLCLPANEGTTVTAALLSLSPVPLAPTHGHRSQKRIRCFPFVSAMTELFIVETDEMVCLMLSFFLHLFLSVFCLLHALPHVSLAFIEILSSSLPAVYIALPLTCSFTVSHFPSCSHPLSFPVVMQSFHIN